MRRAELSVDDAAHRLSPAEDTAASPWQRIPSRPVRIVDVSELALTPAMSLELDPTGAPTQPLVVVDLGQGSDHGTVARAATVVASASPLVVVVTDVAETWMRQMLDVATLTICRSVAGAAVAPHCIVDDDPIGAARRLGVRVAAAPRAAVVLGHVLRQTSQLGVRDALAAEAAAYSTLLGGPEFAAWLAQRGPARMAGGDEAPVVVRREGDVLSLRLNRPHRRNAFNASMREALVEALDVAVADGDVHVQLSGEGPDFCSGGDLDEFGAAHDLAAAYLVRVDRHPGWLLHRLGTRATVHVHGACIGAGVEMPAFADRVTAAPDAYFSLPEVGMGLIPGAGGTVSIPARIGRWRTAWLALTGERLTAATALQWGMVDEVEA